MFSFQKTGGVVRIAKIGNQVVVECEKGFFDGDSNPVTEPESWLEIVAAYNTANMHDHLPSAPHSSAHLYA